MKIRIMVAFMAIATLIFLSCNWFRTKKKESSNPLVGEWKLDSIKAGKDSNAVQIFIAAAMKDPDLSFLFTKDSIFTHSRDTIKTVGYSFDEKEKQLDIKDSSNQTLSFTKVNDSIITLSTSDSAIVFFLQKK